MSKKSDDSIERIFRQALTQYETTFREDDWLKMEKMLNDEANRKAAVRSKRIRGTAYTLTGLTGLIIAVYFLASKNPSGSMAALDHLSKKKQAVEDFMKAEETKDGKDSAGLLSLTTPQAQIQKSTDLRTSNQDHVGQLKNQTSVDAEKTDDIKTPSERSRVSENGSSRSDKKLSAKASPNHTADDVIIDRTSAATEATTEIHAERHAIIEQPKLETKAQSISSTPPDVERKLGSDNQLTESGSSLNTTSTAQQRSSKPFDGNARTRDGIGNVIDSASVLSKPGDTTAPQIKSNNNAQRSTSNTESEKIRTDSLKIYKPMEIVRKDSSEADTESPVKKQIKPASRFSIGVVFSPEFSTTNLDSYSSPGGSIGLRIAYQISNRFSVNTGLIRSNKKYQGKGSDYSPRNPAYWQNRTNGIVPAEIDSKCLVYELPVGVQFDAIQTQKSRVFMSSAISSYFMISQAYDYTFEGPNPGAETGWRSPGSESYWLSVAMFSAGYERYVSHSVAIGIEPYLKVSLEEIGWPNVKLFSTGAYVTLRYKFIKQKD